MLIGIPPRGGGSEAHNSSESDSQQVKRCAICEKKSDHVPIITIRGNKVINYFACEKFAGMSSKQRMEESKKSIFASNVFLQVPNIGTMVVVLTSTDALTIAILNMDG